MRSYYVRNLTASAVTINDGSQEILALEGQGSRWDRDPVPLYVLDRPDFQRLWAAGKVAVYSDAGYSQLLTRPTSGTVIEAVRDASMADRLIDARSGALTVFLGDSITQNLNTLTNPDQPLLGESFATLCAIKSGQRVLYGRNAGVTNNTVQDAAARLSADVIAYRPDRCVVLLGTNNTNQPTPTIPDTMTAYEEGILRPLLDAGIEPIVCTVPPRNGVRASDIATYRRQGQWNAFLRSIASRYHLRLVDLYAATVDPATGDYKAGYSGDGVHPSKVGYQAMSDAFVKAVSPHYPAEGVQLERDRYSAIGLAPNPVFLEGLTGTGNVLPAGWTGSTTGVTVTLEDPVQGDGLEAGKWVKIDKTDTATTKNVNWVKSLSALGAAGTPVAIGDRIAWGFRYKITGSGAVGQSAYVTIALRYTDSGGANARIITPMNQFELDSTGVVYYESAVPPGCTGLRFDVSFAQTSAQEIWLGQMTVRNLTGLSLPPQTRP
ncbi:putative SGNH-hydrolase [Rhodococcus phage E3]|uniref:lipase n=1 Tax=Rhodococcus phage E3 TaxID=1007869 RepID=UPI0002C6B590|nr:lipase [Rhodococcus phage E3]AEQ20997.1 putative SGNH-hydrolase [Rhodococcus phage E3]